MFWAVAPCRLVQIEVFVLSGERGGSGCNFFQGYPCFWEFLPGGGGSGESVDLDGNFDKDLLVLGHYFPGGSYK